MSKRFLVIACLLLTCGLLWGCKKEANGEKVAGQETKEGKKDMVLNPVQLSEAISGVYAKALSDVVAALEGNPAEEEVREKIEKIKEDAIKELVALGHKKQAMSDEQKANINFMVGMNIRGVEGFQAYSDAVEGYKGDFHSLLLEFNVITQYADFELLTKQSPEEAKRLGVKVE